MTPLMRACLCNQPDIAIILLRNGASVSKKSSLNHTAVDFAGSMDASTFTGKKLKPQIVRVAGFSKLHWAVYDGDVDKVIELLNDDRTDIGVKGGSLSETPLDLAISFEQGRPTLYTTEHETTHMPPSKRQVKIAEYLRLATMPWSPSNHSLFPDSFRHIVITILMVACHLQLGQQQQQQQQQQGQQ